MSFVFWRNLKLILPPGLFMALLVGCLFAGYALSVESPGWLQVTAREIQAACRDAGTQWLVVVCLVTYFGVFLLLERRVHSPEENAKNTKGKTAPPAAGFRPPTSISAFFSFLRRNYRDIDFWLVTFVGLVLLRYAFAYATASRSLEVVVLLTGIVIGKAIAFWARIPPARCFCPADGERVAAGRVREGLTILVLLLAGAALWKLDFGTSYQYRGLRRWTGLWDNPNTYGVLMAVGSVLAIGLIVAHATRHTSPAAKAENRKLKAEIGYWAGIILLGVAAIICSIGLVKSYSRGAWVGVAGGLVYLVWKTVTHLTPALSPRPTGGEGESSSAQSVVRGSRRSCVSRLRKSWLTVSAILVSTLVLSFWQFRHSQSPVLRRAFSAANLNDFSWRNRVSAWQGSLRMLLHHPVLGVGWGQVEKRYSETYRAARLEDSAAVQLNDYFTLANSAGISALFCFVAFVGLSLTRSVECGVRNQESAPHSGPLPSAEREKYDPLLPFVCRAAVIVLLIGFWFDGGLFKLPTAVVFWLMMELANAFSRSRFVISESPSVATVELNQETNQPRTAVTVGIRWLAAILGTLALGVTALHLIPPQLEITPGRLKLAREHLIAPTEPADFDYLSGKSFWAGKKLKTLLQHVELANYNRGLVNWKLDDEVYRNFVLSPEISPEFDGTLHWRRILWESFYPRIRKEDNLMTAAEIVVRHLRSRVTIVKDFDPPRSIEEIWIRQITNKKGFEAIYVAALRSAGVPARLDAQGRAEVWNGAEWKPSPRPVIETWER